MKHPRPLAAISLATVTLITACGGGHPNRPASTTARPTTTPAETAPKASAPAKPSAPPPSTATAKPTPAPVFAGRIVTRLPTRSHVVALTFDAGAGATGVPRILATLHRTNTPATFFMTGRFAELFPTWARTIANRYPIGNHTYDHQDLLRLSPAAVTGEIVKAQRAIKRASGRPVSNLFRFPYGSSNNTTLRQVNRAHYTAIGWTVDTLGWEGTSTGQSAHSVLSRVLAALQPGEIVLMHVGANPTDRSTLDANALQAVIAQIRARGYRFVTVTSQLAP